MSTRPTWASYATHDRALHSGLWKGCVYAGAPCLGPTGFKLFDLSGCGHTGTLTNMEYADWLLDGGRHVLSLDGTDERVVVPHNSLFNSAGVGVSCWMRRESSSDAANGRGVVGHCSNGRSWLMYIPPVNDGHLYFLTTNDGNFNDTQIAKYQTLMPNNTWYHVAGSLQSGGNAQLFINGALVATAAASTPSLNVATGPVEIGSYFNGLAATFFQGRIDDVRIYNRPLQQNEIKLLSTRRGIAYEPRQVRRYYGEVLTAAAGGGGGSTISNRLDAVRLSVKLANKLSKR